MTHLKTKPIAGKEQRFAILIEPEFVATPKRHPLENDAELLALIKEHGTVRIHEFETVNPFQLLPRYTELTPEQFEAEWIEV